MRVSYSISRHGRRDMLRNQMSRRGRSDGVLRRRDDGRLLRVRPARVAPALRAERAEDCGEHGEREEEACHGLLPPPGCHHHEAEYGRKNDGQHGVDAGARLHADAAAPPALWMVVLRRTRAHSVCVKAGRRGEEDEREEDQPWDGQAAKVETGPEVGLRRPRRGGEEDCCRRVAAHCQLARVGQPDGSTGDVLAEQALPSSQDVRELKFENPVERSLPPTSEPSAPPRRLRTRNAGLLGA